MRSRPVIMVLIAVLLAAAAGAAFADGIVVPRNVDPASVTIPDQQALISYVDGVETLAIETRFEGAGSEFAWIVPTPALPRVSAGTLGTFPVLRASFLPRVEEVPGLWAVLFVGVVLLCAVLDMLFVTWRTRQWWTAFLVLMILGFGCLLLPTLGKARGMEAGSNVEGVSVHERAVVGAYDVAVIKSERPDALTRWLAENGFAVPPGFSEPLAEYVQEGWCFVASRLRRDEKGQAVMTPHPLVLRFTCDKPVYPMRLTGAGIGQLLALDLYVYASGTAAIKGMTVEQSQPRGIPENRDTHFADMHAELAALTEGTVQATKLSGRFTPVQMHKDLYPEIGEARRVRGWVMGRATAAIVAVLASIMSVFLAGCVLLVIRFANIHGPSRRGAVLILVAVGVVPGMTAWWTLPKAMVGRGQHTWSQFGEIEGRVGEWCANPRYADDDTLLCDQIRRDLTQSDSRGIQGVSEGDGLHQYRFAPYADGWRLTYVTPLGYEMRTESWYWSRAQREVRSLPEELRVEEYAARARHHYAR